MKFQLNVEYMKELSEVKEEVAVLTNQVAGTLKCFDSIQCRPLVVVQTEIEVEQHAVDSTDCKIEVEKREVEQYEVARPQFC